MSQTKPKRTTDFIHLYKPSFVGMAKIAMSFDTPSTAPGLTHIRWIHSHCCCRAYKILSYNSMCPVVWWANWVLQKQKKDVTKNVYFLDWKLKEKQQLEWWVREECKQKKKMKSPKSAERVKIIHVHSLSCCENVLLLNVIECALQIRLI